MKGYAVYTGRDVDIWWIIGRLKGNPVCNRVRNGRMGSGEAQTGRGVVHDGRARRSFGVSFKCLLT